ncbi:hypothetical protein N7466_002721 [Penicillium verhagenii]|uniref:uncharacterized protein n=1 Tax=Penicillium verhagenii TaxID=1562060 RepID=UPI002544EC3E|nr:uncharacterized protein N7466_002721 [Penicillium verhagenii]KAJ5939587.1 hypothetical protein N7466_002721 [Penicillium verhagenii]
MLFPSSSSWGIATVTALFAVTAYGVPLRESPSETESQRGAMIQPRDPRIIPDTENYIHSVFDMLGLPALDSVLSVASSSSSSAASETPASSSHAIDVKVTPTPTPTPTPTTFEKKPTPSPTTTADEVTFSTTIKNGNDRPVENIQIGQGWKGSNRIQASDVPFIMGAVESALADRFNDMIDSSDELGLKK